MLHKCAMKTVTHRKTWAIVNYTGRYNENSDPSPSRICRFGHLLEVLMVQTSKISKSEPFLVEFVGQKDIDAGTWQIERANPDTMNRQGLQS